jgi:hypothetical protein
MAGVTVRHNRALRDVNDWAETVKQFFRAYGLDENTGIEKLLANSGDVKFELTEIVYKGRLLISQAGKLKNKKIALMIAGIIDSMESIRRYLINPALQRERLSRGVANLLSLFKTFQNTLKEIEYV